MDLGLTEKRVLITGSSRGIGLAIAEGFLKEQSRVMLTSRNCQDLEELQVKLSRKFPTLEIMTFECDFTHSDAVVRLKEQVLKVWGGVDIVVANVGSGRSVPDPIPSKEHFEKAFCLNFDASVSTAREFYPLLKESKGNLLFIASIVGIEAFGAPVDYSVAKTAIIAFSKNLARKIAADGVRVNCIAPGNVYFEGGDWDEKLKTDSESINQLIKATVPMKRFGKPEEIANSVLFMCSERSSFTTGGCLVIDGGQTYHF
jgi:3-oxoacyl-[acyl-carrier protein] reductase